MNAEPLPELAPCMHAEEQDKEEDDEDDWEEVGSEDGSKEDEEGAEAPQKEFPHGRKLFVGGLGWDTHQSHLDSYFSQFGSVVHAEVMCNRDTGVSRGFGFVTFADGAAAEAANSQRHHRIHNKTAEIKFAVQRGDTKLVTQTMEEKLAKQVFVGRLPKDASPDELKEWAQKVFGVEAVTSAIVVLDLKTKLPRGFGFVSFHSAELAEKALYTAQAPEVCEFRDGYRVQVKRAHDRGRKNASKRDKRGGDGHHQRSHKPSGGPPQQDMSRALVETWGNAYQQGLWNGMMNAQMGYYPGGPADMQMMGGARQPMGMQHAMNGGSANGGSANGGSANGGSQQYMMAPPSSNQQQQQQQQYPAITPYMPNMPYNAPSSSLSGPTDHYMGMPQQQGHGGSGHSRSAPRQKRAPANRAGKRNASQNHTQPRHMQ